MTSNQSKIPVADKERLFSFLQQKKNGVVLLEGPSGCGKTSLMQELVREAEFPLLLTSQELVDLLLTGIEKEGFIADAIDSAFATLEEFGLVIIEDIDMQKGKETTLEIIGKLVNRLSQKAVVLFTGIRLWERVPVLLEKLHIDLWIKTGKKECEDMIPFVITGDTHGEYGRLLEIHQKMEQYPAKEKYLCVCGDFGYLFKNDFSEHRLLNEIEQQDYTMVVIPGNHENYAEFMKYNIVDFHGAKAYQVRKNIFYILRGEIFELGGKSFFCMGGGYSIDCYMRQKDVSWWEEEMPTDAEYQHAASNLEAYRKTGKKIDYILSHTAPLSGLRYLQKDHGAEEYPLNNFLEYVLETLGEEYTCHYFGHLHLDQEIPFRRLRALWFDYEELMLSDDKTLEK